MAKTIVLTAARLREKLHYDPDTGQFRRLPPLIGGGHKRKVGGLDSHGHIQIEIDDHPYLAHRLAWLWMLGDWPPPDKEIDHINLIRDDNRWINLRLVTGTENRRNHSGRKNNTSGTVGVSWNKRARRWYVRLWGQPLGSFCNKEEAIEAAKRFLELRHRDLG